jgi:hypothetical protein
MYGKYKLAAVAFKVSVAMVGIVGIQLVVTFAAGVPTVGAGTQEPGGSFHVSLKDTRALPL